MEKDPMVQGTSISGSKIKGPMFLGTTNPRLGNY